jgi:DNA-binding NarL/FixJ family response regulator
MIRVLFVDDDRRVRECWSRLLEAQSDIELVGTLDQADRLVEVVQRVEPDVVVLDLTMPGLDPIEAARRLTESDAGARVIFYSGHDDPSLMDAAYDAGAWGFVDKLAAPDAIIEVIRSVAQDTPVFPVRSGHGRFSH